jgi:chitinase
MLKVNVFCSQFKKYRLLHVLLLFCLGSYKSAVALKSLNPGLRVMLAIGGWNEGGKKYSQMSSSPESRRRFIKSAVDLLADNGFDGLDLDWEYPGATDRSWDHMYKKIQIGAVAKS